MNKETKLVIMSAEVKLSRAKDSLKKSLFNRCFETDGELYDEKQIYELVFLIEQVQMKIYEIIGKESNNENDNEM